MILNLSEVLSEQHKTIETKVMLEMTDFKVSSTAYEILKKEPVSLSVVYAGEKKLVISGESAVIAKIPCDRCLEDVEVLIPLVFEKRVNLLEDTGNQSDETDENNYIDGYNLDVEQLIHNELLVGWPTKILCSEDCKGICNVCGQKLNEGTCSCEDTSLDPRMSVIRDVFKNFKEV